MGATFLRGRWRAPALDEMQAHRRLDEGSSCGRSIANCQPRCLGRFYLRLAISKKLDGGEWRNCLICSFGLLCRGSVEWTGQRAHRAAVFGLCKRTRDNVPSYDCRRGELHTSIKSNAISGYLPSEVLIKVPTGNIAGHCKG